MTAIIWDAVGEHFYETGVDHGVLYVQDPDGTYPLGVPWNGLVSVSEAPTGAEVTPTYADNIKYLNLVSLEEFGFTIEAYTYPDEFMECDGTIEAVLGTFLGQQARKNFGFVYRTKIGNDVAGNDLGYKLHLVYGCTASPSERSYQTINDSPEVITFSWEVMTVPAAATGFMPVSLITIDSRTADPSDLAALELVLFGTVGVDPELPTPDEVITAMTPP